ncbi:hypothetical protein MTO96_010043 [Rhipicephalus appendiculatus]
MRRIIGEYQGSEEDLIEHIKNIYTGEEQATPHTTFGLLPLPFSSPSEGSCVRVAPGPLDCWVRRQEKGEAVSRAGKKRRRSSSSLDTHSAKSLSRVFATSQEWRKINGRDSPGEGSVPKPLEAAGLNERAISDGQIALAASMIQTPLHSGTE